jgi:hypothetical protein
VLLYRVLAAGVMSVITPVPAVTAAVLPLGVGLAFDRTPGHAALIGAGCAVLAIGLVSLGTSNEQARLSGRMLSLSLAAGATFGTFFTLLDQVPADAGLWPLISVRAASLVVGGALAERARLPLRLTGRPLLALGRRWRCA